MKRFFAFALAAALGLATASTAYAVSANYADDSNTYDKSGEDVGYSVANPYVAGDMANGINNSRHNLGALGEHMKATGVFGQDTSVGPLGMGTTEICVFCHTPHHATSKVSGAYNDGTLMPHEGPNANTGMWTNAPLWNRRLQSATTTYTVYGAGGANKTTAQTDTTMVVGSASLACLSCHDGVTTLDNIVNAPGPAKSNNAWRTGKVVPGGLDQGWTLTEADNPTFDLMGTYVGVGLAQAGRTVIGTNLTNDHPVSVEYKGAGHATPAASLRTRSTIINDINLTIGLSDSADTFNGGNLTQNLWAVNGYISDTATISDILKANTPGGERTQVECTSCHDPHFKNQSWTEVQSSANGNNVEVEGAFLRRVGGNTGSGVCRTCHAK